MIYFSSETGLPGVESRGLSVAHRGVGNVPDLLEDQQAQLQLTCDCGASSSHQAACSLHIKGSRAFPTHQKPDLVVCPVCNAKIPLVRPLVIHDEPRKRVVLRLPESFRMRANAVLSWWFDWLQHANRAIIPAYARAPELSFMPEGAQRGTAQAAPASAPASRKATPVPATRKATPAPKRPIDSPNRPTEPPPSRPSLTVPSPSDADALLDSLTSGLPGGMPSRTPEPARPTKESASSPALQTISSLPTSKPAATPSAAEPAPTKKDLSTPVGRQTLDFASRPKERNDLSFSEFPLDEISGEFDEFEEADEAMPTLMVAVPEPANRKKRPRRRPPRNTMAITSSPSVVVSSDEMGMLHEEKEDEGTLISPEAIAKANRGGVVVARGNIPGLGGMMGDPGATREAPAPILDDDDEEVSLLDSLDPDDTMQAKIGNALAPPPASDLSAEVSDGLDAIAESKKPKGPLPDAPTVARRMSPQSLSEIRSSQSRAATAVRNIVGNGISISPEYDEPKPAHKDVLKAWNASGEAYHYGMSPVNHRSAVHFVLPQSKSRVLDQGGELLFHMQLHRLSSYPLLVVMLSFRNAHGETTDVLATPINVDDHNGLLFLDMLMQDFSLYVYLCHKDKTVYRDLQVQLPLEDNVEYLLEQARAWKGSLSQSSLSFERAWKEFSAPGYDQLGKMEHNFNQDSFAEIDAPAQAQLASGIVAYWSEPEQFDYLITMKSFPIAHFRTIQRRTIEGCMSYGVFMPVHLRQLALDFELAPSQQKLLERMLSSFAETNLAIRQPNDLDPWDNLTNWQKLLDACDEYHVNVDEDIEELAELAQRRCQSDGENTHNVDDDDIMEIDGYDDMDSRELIELLQEPLHRLDAAFALCDRGEPQYADYVAGVFSHLEREQAIALAEAFIQFGAEAEPLLISWLHLPRPHQREAAMLALGSMGSTQAIDEIIKRLRSGEEWETAAEALGRIGEPAIGALSQEIKNKNWLIRLRAVKALQKVHSDRTRPLFEQLRSDPNEVVKAEVAAILND
jgi:hypothetical protein